MKNKAKNMGNGIFQLTPEHCMEIFENGFSLVKLDDGREIKVTKDDLYIDKKEIDKIINEKTTQNNPE